MVADWTKTNRNTLAHFSLWTEAGKQQCHMGTAERLGRKTVSMHGEDTKDIPNIQPRQEKHLVQSMC